jgi:hypothetical protein
VKQPAQIRLLTTFVIFVPRLKRGLRITTVRHVLPAPRAPNFSVTTHTRNGDFTMPATKPIALTIPAPKFIVLEDKIEDVGSLRFLRAEWQHDRSRFVLIRYARNGREEPLGLRLDLDKKVLLDNVEDPELDKSVQVLSSTIWSIVATERLQGNIFQC